MTREPVRASGGLVFRPLGDTFEVLLVHRPRYDDWSFPKGKDDPGESPVLAALREVEEETGYRCRVVAPIGSTRYTIPSGQPKEVRYFAMRPLDRNRFRPNPEVDEVRWIPAPEAPGRLTYRHDEELITATDIGGLPDSGTLFLVRHAEAGRREKWTGDDGLRPLTDVGLRQSEALARSLGDHPIDLILSSPAVRCRQTVERLAARRELPVVDHEALDEGADPSATLALVESLIGLSVVMSSHGDVIPGLVESLGDLGAELRSPTGVFECRKGSTWQVSTKDGRFTRADYVPPPAV